MFQADKQILFLTAATLCASLGAIVDVRSRRLPNIITLPAMLAGLLLHAAVDGWQGLLNSLGALALCATIFLVFYLAGGMGAGDLKMMAAVGALSGLPSCTYALVLTSIAGGVLGLGVALARGRLKEVLADTKMLAGHHRQYGLTEHPEINVRNSSKLRLPYGLAIAAGTAATLFLFCTQGLSGLMR